MDTSWTKSASEVAQTLGFAGAAIFFLYKAISGYLRVNLGMKVTCDRQPASDGMDFLAIAVHLKKGQNGTLVMHDLSARITYGVRKDEVRFDGVTRSVRKLDSSSRVSRARLDWNTNDDESPLLKLVPEEGIDLTVLHMVPTDAVCLVQVCLLAQALSRPVFGQYKCSTASFPRKIDQ